MVANPFFALNIRLIGNEGYELEKTSINVETDHGIASLVVQTILLIHWEMTL